MFLADRRGRFADHHVIQNLVEFGFGMLKPRKSPVLVLLSALAALPAMATETSHAERVGQLMERVAWHRTLDMISDGVVAQDRRLSALPDQKRACVVGVVRVTIEEMMLERLAERMTVSEVQHWLDFTATAAGNAFAATFPFDSQAQLVSADDVEPLTPVPADAAEADAFKFSAAFMAFVNALSGGPTFDFQRSKDMHQRFQSDCDVSRLNAT